MGIINFFQPGCPPSPLFLALPVVTVSWKMDGWGSNPMGVGRGVCMWGGREDTKGTERRQLVRVRRPLHRLRWARARPLARQLGASAVC